MNFSVSRYLTTAFVMMVSGFLMINTGCQKDNCESVSPGYYTRDDLNKAIVQTLVTNVSTGLAEVFMDDFPDSVSRTDLARTFTHAARFLDDNAGYVFVETLSGYSIANAANPSLEGTYTYNITDAYGAPLVSRMIDLVQHSGVGYIEYAWNDPETNHIATKESYVIRIPATDWYSGGGFFRTVSSDGYSAQQVNDQVVINAVTAMSQGLAGVLPSMGDSVQQVEFMRSMLRYIRFFDDHSGYFYVIDYNGYNVVQPPNPDIQGTDEWNIQDSHGNYLVQGLIAMARNGGGFYEYYWINYQTQQEELKKAYVMPVPGYDYLIGSGTYLSAD